MPRVIHGFSFFNEIRLLEFKLEELFDVVDYFVIVESCETHSGKPKPFYFQEHQDTVFQKYRSKIVYVKMEEPIETNDPWVRETSQRNEIWTGIQTLSLDHEDILLIGDLDEIPNAFYVAQMRTSELCYDGVVRMRQDLYYYNLNCKSNTQFTGLYYVTFGDMTPLMDQGATLSILRRCQLPYTEFVHGWHLSFFGGISSIQEKLRCFAHSHEYDQGKFTETYVQQCIEKQENIFQNEGDMFGSFHYIPIHLNTNLPVNYRMLLTTET